MAPPIFTYKAPLGAQGNTVDDKKQVQSMARDISTANRSSPHVEQTYKREAEGKPQPLHSQTPVRSHSFRPQPFMVWGLVCWVLGVGVGVVVVAVICRVGFAVCFGIKVWYELRVFVRSSLQYHSTKQSTLNTKTTTRSVEICPCALHHLSAELICSWAAPTLQCNPLTIWHHKSWRP